jgi:hypothetical protein
LHTEDPSGSLERHKDAAHGAFWRKVDASTGQQLKILLTTLSACPRQFPGVSFVISCGSVFAGMLMASSLPSPLSRHGTS